MVLAVWVRKLEPKSTALFYYLGDVVCLFGIFVASMASTIQHTQSPMVSLLQLASWGVSLMARFSLKNILEQHYNSDEKMGLVLSGVMTFFFGSIYFQYHMNEIVRRKGYDRMSYRPV